MRLWWMRCPEVARHVDVAKSHSFADLVKGLQIQTSLLERDTRIELHVADKRDIWVFLQSTNN